MLVSILAIGSLSACGGPSALSFDGPEGASVRDNYQLSTEIRIGEVQVAAESDLLIDWSDFTTDLRGRPIDDLQITELSMVRFDQDKGSVLDGLNRNYVRQADAQLSYLFNPTGDQTTARIADFDIAGNPLIPREDLVAVDPTEQNWLLTLFDTSSGRRDALTSKFVDLVQPAPNTAVTLTDGCAELDLEVDLHTAPPMTVQGGRDDYTLEWSAIESDVFGNAFDPLDGDELFLAHFDVQDVTRIEAVFARLDTEADELYRLSVHGVTSADLMQAEDDAGRSFGGFTTDGIWLVGIACTGCLNPAPLWIVVLDVT
ncbi:MAG: hypothetical protein KTR31_18720 [Myxococcales bacterium]|nr:hypothetical protein [Myxococcales bacterium]